MSNNSLTLGVTLFLQSLPDQKVPVNSYLAYRRDLHQFIGYLGDQGIEAWPEIGLQTLQEYLRMLEGKGDADKTVYRVCHSLKRLFRHLQEVGIILDDHAAALIPPTYSDKKRRVLTIEECRKVLNQVDTVRNRAILLLFLNAGLQVAELSRLTIDDLSLPAPDQKATGLVILRRKGRTREVPLKKMTCSALQDWLVERNRVVFEKQLTTTALFLSDRGLQLSYRQVQRVATKYMRMAGIDDVTTRNLRHTSAKHQLDRGRSLKELQDFFGHQSLKTTAIYTNPAKIRVI